MVGADNPIVVTMDRAYEITVDCVEPSVYTLGLSGTGAGSVKVDGTEQPLPWTGEFPAGTAVTLMGGDGRSNGLCDMMVLHADSPQFETVVIA